MGLIDTLLSFVLPAPPEIEPGEDVVFVDVRTPREHARQRVVGAKGLDTAENAGGLWGLQRAGVEIE